MNTDSRQAAALTALRSLPGIGSRRLRALLGAFGTPMAAWEAGLSDWTAALGEKTARAAFEKRPGVDMEAVAERLERDNIRPITEEDADYPELLRAIPDPPYLIYARGDIGWDRQPLIAIVGTRRPTEYGSQVTERLATELSGAGFGIVSGLAFGVDGITHRAALEAGGYTVGVLGDGLDDASIHPRSHLPLARTLLAKHGTLVSEYPPGTPAAPGTFPARNRIMAALSLGTLVVEAAEKSGSLITARWAVDFGREVFAVPGSVNSLYSAGPHALIRQGAKLVSGVGHILEEFGPRFSLAGPTAATSAGPLPDLSEDELLVMRHLESEPRHVDKLARLATLETTRLSAALTLLEVKGLAKNVGTMHYIKCKT